MEGTPQIRVGDVMTKNVVSIDANDTLDVIAGLFEKYDFDGMPVVDHDHKLLGIITAYDMILQSSDIHLPTLLKLMNQISREGADRRELEEHFSKLRSIKATSIMNPKVVSISADAVLEEAAKIFTDHPKANPIIVVTPDGKLAGVISRYDVIKFFNEAYLLQVVGQVTPGHDPFKEFPTRSENEVEKAVQKIQDEFLLVSKRRPLIWKYAAIGTFVAGLIAATALIIRIVQRQ